MKIKNPKLNVLSHIIVTIVIVTVFIVGSWVQWQENYYKSDSTSIQSKSIALAKLFSGVDLAEPASIMEHEAHVLESHLKDEQVASGLTEEALATIVDEVSLVEPQQTEILDPKLQTLEASYESDKRVFIYHSHARESWHGEQYSADKNASSKDMNITLLGEKLAEELATKGIGSVVSTTDYATAVPDYEWAYSYKYSRKSVKEVLAAHDEIEMVFDLHRDSQPREYTTATIDGQDYAQLYFIIGKRNPNWEQNYAFAERLNKKIDALYPGLSRGIWGKNANSGNGEYNQSLHTQNVLIEVGGVDNTLDENYRTLNALAHVISLVVEEDEVQ